MVRTRILLVVFSFLVILFFGQNVGIIDYRGVSQKLKIAIENTSPAIAAWLDGRDTFETNHPDEIFVDDQLDLNIEKDSQRQKKNSEELVGPDSDLGWLNKFDSIREQLEPDKLELPQKLAGFRMDPPPSAPSAIGHRPAATAAPGPDEEPPVNRSTS